MYSLYTTKAWKIIVNYLLSKQYFILLQLKMMLVNVSKCSTTLFQLSLTFIFLLKLFCGQIYAVYKTIWSLKCLIKAIHHFSVPQAINTGIVLVRGHP